MNLQDIAKMQLKHYKTNHSHWTPANQLYHAGWDDKGEWTCAKCGTGIGKNLNGEKPFVLARQHAEKCC